MSYNILFCVIIGCLINGIYTTDPCNTVLKLNHEDKRSPLYNSAQATYCDVVITEGWYRMDEDMPTSCVPQGRCGTTYPIWLNGTIPTVSEGVVDRRVCISSMVWGCCQSFLNIQVKNCGNYRVYNLVQTNGCPQGYCFGDMEKTSTTLPFSTTTRKTITNTTVAISTTRSSTKPADPCNTVLKLNHEDKRSPLYNSAQATYCDVVITEGWYRMDEDMPTSCVPQGRCGTTYPIWLNGTIPTVSDGVVDRRVCISSMVWGCCQSFLNIQVKNCGNYRVYNLVQTNGCPQGYCFGDMEKTSTTLPFSTTTRKTITNTTVAISTTRSSTKPADPCNTVLKLNHEDKRSPLYNSAQATYCDVVITEGWYRMDEDMPTSCVPQGRCGTTYPIWLNGTIPTVSEGVVDRRVCISSMVWGCCQSFLNIQVKNCGNYRVYNLVQTNGCPQGYCFGDMEKTSTTLPSSTTTRKTVTNTTVAISTTRSSTRSADPCDTNVMLVNEEKRSPSYITRNEPLCDVIVTERWYRPNKDMPTSCVPQRRCGTTYPIWLNGTIPAVSEGVVDRRVCISSYFLGCCASYLNIQVKNCGNYRVYNLVQTNGCPQGYCFGDMEKKSTTLPSSTTTRKSITTAPVSISTTMSSTKPAEPCDTDVMLENEGKRSPSYITRKKPLCDVMVKERWYRPNKDMPTSCVPQRRCGTTYPIWLNGTIPAVSEGVVERRACISSSFWGCCASYLNIRVKNCGNYRVYNLVQTNGCNQAYCFGDTDKEKSTTVPPSTTATKVLSTSDNTPFTVKTTKLEGQSTSSNIPDVIADKKSVKDDATKDTIIVLTVFSTFTLLMVVMAIIAYCRRKRQTSGKFVFFSINIETKSEQCKGYKHMTA